MLVDGNINNLLFINIYIYIYIYILKVQWSNPDF